jgi:predicted transcriptional regulator
MDVIELLQQLGFSEYEARAYVALLQRHPMNGYAIAKLSGIPRANVYGVLHKLEERGAVVRVETADGMDYVPVRPDILTQRLSDGFEGTLQSARALLESIGNPAENDYVENIQGYQQLVQHAQDVISQARNELVIAVWQPEAELLSAATAEAETRGVEFTTLCFQACTHECGGCRGEVFRYSMTLRDNSRSMIVVADNTEMVFGAVGAQQTTASRTRQQQVVEMTSWYIRHSIAAAALVVDLRDNLENIVSPETRMVLQTLGPEPGWIESVRNLLAQSKREPNL